MNDSEERVLEHALRELFSEETSDLPERVLEAWQRPGASGSGNEYTGTETPRRRSWFWAAAAVAVSLLALSLLRDAENEIPDSSEVVVATAERPFDVLRAGSPDRSRQSSLRSGETLVNGPMRERRLTLATGETVVLGRCSMLRLEQTKSGIRIAPLVGETTVIATGPTDVQVVSELGEITLNGAASLRVEMLADGYGLEHPERFQQLSKEIHMSSNLPLILTAITVLQGSASVSDASGTQSIEAGETLRQEQEDVPVAEIRAKLLEAIGTWDITVTEIGADGEPRRTYKGEEHCGAGPGDKWLITDTTLRSGNRPITIHTVVGFDPRSKTYTGTLYDNFGGELGLLRGTPGEDLDRRTLSMYSAKSTPGFDVRWHMSWISPNERHKRMEVLQDDVWVHVGEMVYLRRE